MNNSWKITKILLSLGIEIITITTMKTKNSLGYNQDTIVMFHIGKGGRFYNPSHLSFQGVKKITECSDFCDLYCVHENQNKIAKLINHKPNLLEKFVECQSSEDFTFFEKLGFTLGKKIYVDNNGNPVELAEEEANNGVGTINIDNSYDTTYTKCVKDLSDSEIQIIRESDVFEQESLVDLFEELEMI